MPVYNGAQFVRAAIESVLDNGFADLELVVVDDASTDDTVRVVEAIRHPAIRLVRQPENLGVAVTRRCGILLLNGRHLALLDQDDIAVPGRFAAQVDALERAGGPDIVGGAVECFGDAETVLQFPLLDAEIRAGLLFFSLPLVNPAVCMKLEPFRQGRIAYSVEAGPAADYALWVDAMRNGLRFTNLAQTVTRYRRHAASHSQQTSELIVTKSGQVRGAVVAAFFPQMTAPEQQALVDALTRLIGGGRRWVDSVYAMSRAVKLAPAVPGIASQYLIAQMQAHLLRMIDHVLRHKLIDYETLESMTDNNEDFEHWRMADGGALDREIMALVAAHA